MTNTRVATGFYLVASINVFHSKSILLYLDAWKIFFNYPTIQEYYFSLSEARIASFFSLATPRVVVGSLILAS